MQHAKDSSEERWHRCTRWEVEGLKCPFEVLGRHERDGRKRRKEDEEVEDKKGFKSTFVREPVLPVTYPRQAFAVVEGHRDAYMKNIVNVARDIPQGSQIEMPMEALLATALAATVIQHQARAAAEGAAIQRAAVTERAMTKMFGPRIQGRGGMLVNSARELREALGSGMRRRLHPENFGSPAGDAGFPLGTL